MKFLYLSAALLLSVSLMACGSEPEPEEIPMASETENGEFPQEFVDHHNARNSLDYAGEYTGITPCANCEGIRTTVTITYEGTFTKTMEYLGYEDDSEHRFEGEYSWNDAGNTITLQGLEDQPSQYFVGENMLVQLDMDGNRVTGELAEMYILTKSF
ncbi:MAG: copper resistance protein NlpE [Balneolia bacterium]|nr:copper resistance protein NlpE [Balneolia bacterium]